MLVLGTVEGMPVAVMRGRAHLYEGIGADRAVFGVRVLARLGIRTLVVTNAAGAIDESYPPGMLVLISDHVNLMGTVAGKLGHEQVLAVGAEAQSRLTSLLREVLPALAT